MKTCQLCNEQTPNDLCAGCEDRRQEMLEDQHDYRAEAHCQVECDREEETEHEP